MLFVSRQFIMKNFKSYKNFLIILIVAFLSGGAIVYADFIRTSGSTGFGYGYGYDTSTSTYGYGYGYHQNDTSPTSRELYGFPGDDGEATSISVSVTCNSATISYTSDYLAKHRVAYGVSSVVENATSLTDYESGPQSITLSGLSASTTYLYVLGSTDAGGGSWPATQSSFTTSASCSSGGGGVVLEQYLRSNTGTIGDSSIQKFQFLKDLKRGMLDSDVKELQKFLNTHGFPLAKSGFGSPGNETFFFGPRTQQALRAYQKANGITPSAGYFGAKTRAVVNEQIN